MSYFDVTTNFNQMIVKKYRNYKLHWVEFKNTLYTDIYKIQKLLPDCENSIWNEWQKTEFNENLTNIGASVCALID